jgi:hypothetical protein
MPTPQQLRDRAAHGVADDDGALDAEHLEQRGGVVGRVAHPERAPRADAAPVTAVVEGDDVQPLVPKRAERREPVEIGVGRPPVQEQDRRRPGSAFDLANPGAAATGQDDLASRGEGRAGHETEMIFTVSLLPLTS